MNYTVHPTAIVNEGASVGAGTIIGPYCVVGENVSLGENVVLKSHVVVDGYTEIGAGTQIYPFASIGSAPQDLKYAGEKTFLRIGKNNVIREHVTMNPGTVGDRGETVVGDNGLFMMGCHVAHDCRLGHHVIMANNATLAGHVHIGNFVLLGGLCAVHQFVRIGDHAVIGGMSGVAYDVIPYGRVKGERAFLSGLNLVGLERHGFSKPQIRELQRAYNQIFAQTGTIEERIESAAAHYSDNDTVQKIVGFARGKDKFPLLQPPRKK